MADKEKMTDAVRQLMDNNLKHISDETLRQRLRNATKELELVKARLTLALLQEEWKLAKGLKTRKAVTMSIMQGIMDNITRKAELEAEE